MQRSRRSGQAIRGGLAATLVVGSLSAALVGEAPQAFAGGPTCATSGAQGAGGTLTGVVNTYYPLTASAAAGATSLTVGTATGSSTPIAAGDELLVIQVQGATLSTTNSNNYGAGDGTGRGATAITAGTYEYVKAAGAVSGGAVSIVGGAGAGLLNAYTVGTNATVEVVRVPQYSSGTLSSGLTASAWNGSTGGILAMDVSGTLALGSTTVSLNGLGFRAGRARVTGGGAGASTDYVTGSAAATNAEKGEGDAGSPLLPPPAAAANAANGYPGGDFARGAPGNAGGGGTDGDPAKNDDNSGGAGGGNGGIGGAGGNSYGNNIAVGGVGGAAFAATDRAVVLGGGGGAGSNNNATNSSSGAAGGGIALIRAATTTGTGTISANGATALGDTDIDAGGGGGAGGSIVVTTPTGGSLTGLTGIALGGAGGNAASGTTTPHGPGGGGAGGWVVSSSALAATTVTGGVNGTTGTTNNAQIPYGALAGGAGQTSTTATATDIPGVYSGAKCSGSISGYVFDDANADGTRAATGEGAVAASGQTVTVTNSAGTVVGTVTAGSGGAYTLANLPTGTAYTVSTPAISGQTASTSLSQSVAALAVDGTATANFGFYTPGAIGGTIYGDPNDNQTLDSSETALPVSSTVSLTDASGNQVVNASGATVAPVTVAANAGTYSFPNLKPGSYQIVVTGTTGYVQTTQTVAPTVNENVTTQANVGEFKPLPYTSTGAAGANQTATVTVPTGSTLSLLTTTATSGGVTEGSYSLAGTVITFVPASNYSGSAAPATYQLTEGSQSATSTYTPTVTPLGVTDTYTTPFNTVLAPSTVPTGVLGNDVGATLQGAKVVGTTSHGGLTLNGNGTFTYTPTTTYAGPDSFTYTATDGTTTYGPTTVNISVGKPAAPTAVPESFTTAAVATTATTGNSVTVAVLTDNPGADSGTGTLTPHITTQAVNGKAVVNSDGTITYTANQGFSGSDPFSYDDTDTYGQTSNIVQDPVTVTPVGADDPGYTTSHNTALTQAANGGVLTNDIGKGLTVTGINGATGLSGTTTLGGKLAMNSDGSFTFTPTTTEYGADTFTYNATDGVSTYTKTATITVGKPAAPTAMPESFTTTAVAITAKTGNSVTVAVLTDNPGADSGTGKLTPHITTQAVNGKAVVNSDGTITYTANPGFSGSDPFSYDDTDTYGQTSNIVQDPVTVTPVGADDPNYAVTYNTALTQAANGGVLTNDIGKGLTVTRINNTTTLSGKTTLGGAISVAGDGSFTFTPTATENGKDTFTYTANDGTSTYTQTATILVGKPAAPLTPSDMKSTSAGKSAGTPVTLSGYSGQTYTQGSVITRTDPLHGMVAAGSTTGSYVYTPNGGYSGPDSFTYTVTDTANQSSTGTESITVTPLGNDDSYSTGPDTPLTKDAAAGVLANDIGTPLSVTGVNGTTSLTGKTTLGGSVTVGSDGSFTFTPIDAEYGADTFTYTATDGTSTYHQTATITVGRPTPPSTPGDARGTTAGPVGSTGTPVTLNGYSTATYAPNSTFAITTNATNGKVTPGSSTGTYVYTPNGGFSGTDSFVYTVTDPTGQPNSGTETVTVAPVGMDDPNYKTAFNTVYSPAANNGLLANDIGTKLTVTAINKVANTLTGTTTLGGHVAVNSDGTFTFTPSATEAGADTFTYTATDGTSSYTQTATITVANPPVPVVVTDNFATTATVPAGATTGTPVTVPVLGNDKVTGPVTITIVKQPSNGKAVVTSANAITYTPMKGFSGSDPFSYYVTDGYAGGQQSNPVAETVTVTPAASPDSITDNFPAAAMVAASTLLANDEGSALTVTSVDATSADGGKVSLSTDGSTVTYTPPASYPATGTTDSFNYVATDSAKQTATAMVTVTLAKPGFPAAPGDKESTPANTPKKLAGSSGQTYTAGTKITNSQPSHGSVGPANSDGSYTYTPTSNYSGPDSFTYTATDAAGQASTGTESVTVTPVGTADAYNTKFNTVLAPATMAAGVLGNDIGTGLHGAAVVGQAVHGSVTLSDNGTFTYQPTNNYAGPDSFTYTATDGTTAYGPVTVSITVGKPPVPVAKPESFTATAVAASSTTANPVTVAVLSNAQGGTDTGTGALTPVIGSQPLNGSAVVNSDGTITYTAHKGFSGSDPFTYYDTDTYGQKSSTVQEPVLVTPVAVPDSLQETFPSAADVSAATLLSNDIGTSLSITSVDASSADGGSVTLSTDKSTVTYTPPSTYPAGGSDTFHYTATDSNSQTTTTVVTVTLNKTGVPVTPNDMVSTPAGKPRGTAVRLPASSGQTHPSGTTFSNTPAANGSVTIDADGSYTYTPNGGYSGPDSFTYTVTDAAGQASTGKESITVVPVGADDPGYTTGPNAPLPENAAAGVLANDIGTPLSVTGVNGTTSLTGKTSLGGSVTVGSDGSFTFTPIDAEYGADTFTYTATDGTSTYHQTATITVGRPTPPSTPGDARGTTAGPVGSTGTPVTLNGYSTATYAPNSTFAITTNATNGKVTPGSSTGTYVYTPNGGFSGTDSFVYTVTDPTGQPNSGTETVTVVPVAQSGTQNVTAGSTLSASTPAGIGTAPFTVALFQAPAENTGSFALDPSTGAYTYTPKPGFVGTDSFTYTVSGAGGTSVPATITITTMPAKPTAPDDTQTTTAGNPAGAAVTLAGSRNATATGAFTVTNSAAKYGGAITPKSDGSYTFVPAKNFSGTDSFTYTVKDAYNQLATGIETIIVTPTTVADAIKVANSTAYPANASTLTANDSGSGLTVTAVTAKSAQGGTVKLAGGSFTYTPPAGYTGTDSFGYTDTDTSNQTVNGTVSVTVLPPAPVANNDTASTTAGTPLTLAKAGVLLNDSGAGPLSVTSGSTTTPANGGLTGGTVNSDGSFTYTPKAGFSGSDSFTYTATDTSGQTSAPATVSITVKPVANADSQAVAAGTTLKATTPAATGSGNFTVALVTPPADGTGGFAIDPGTGAYSYTPKPGFTGTDSFTYTVTGAGGTSAAARVTITVGTPAPPKAMGDNISTVANKGVDTTGSGTSLLTNDTGDGPLSVPAGNYTQPATGTGTVQVNADGTYIYTPPTGYSGTTSFTYTPVDVTNQAAASPATVVITVVPVAQPATESTRAGSPVTFSLPAGVGSGALPSTVVTQPSGQLTSNPDGTYTYTPKPGFLGNDSFTYTVSGAGGTSQAATVSINVSTPKPPAAGDDSYPATTDASLTVPAPGVLINDSGAGPLTPSYPVTSTHGGAITAGSNGAFTYSPPTGFSGTDTFTYTDTDTVNQPSNAATVTITVSPTTQPDSYNLTGGKPYTSPTSVLANDDGSKITAVLVLGPTHGSLGLKPDGTFTYTPVAGYTGADSFTYRASDGISSSAITTASLTVFKPTPPVGQPDRAGVVAGSGATAEPSVLTNDVGVALTLGATTATTAGGTVVTSANGTYTYQPPAGFSGTDTFTYVPVDGYQQPGAPVTVSVTVSPAASPASVQVRSGSTATGNLPAGIGSPTLTYAGSLPPAHGSLTINPDGSYSYTPTPGYLGADAFGYTVTGPGGTSLPATVSLNVVSPVGPIGTPGSTQTPAGTALNGSVAGSETGFGPLVTTLASAPTNGTLALGPDGGYTYTPAPGFSGTDSFSYVATDPFNQVSVPVTETILVTPVSNPDSAGTTEGGVLAGASVLGNDLGSGLTAVQAAGPAHGSLSLNPDGTFTYTPAAGFAGTDSFSYIAVDSAGNRTAATPVSFTVSQVVPVVTGGTSQSVAVGTGLLPITFTDPSGVTPTVSTSTPGALPPGVTLAPSGALVGQATKAGTYTFPVTVTDPAGGAVTRQVTIVVTSVPVVVSPTPHPATTPLGTVTQVGTTLRLPTLGGPILKVTGHLPPGIRVEGQSLVGTSSRAGSYVANVSVRIHGRTLIRRVTILVRPANPVQPTGPLAFTGAPVPIGQAVGLGLMLLLLGALLLTIGGRRRQRRS